MRIPPFALSLVLAAALPAYAEAPLFLVDSPFDPPQKTAIYTVDPSTGAMTLRADVGNAYTPLLALAAVDARTLYAVGADNGGTICPGSTFGCLLLKIVLDPASSKPTSVDVIGPLLNGGTPVTGVVGMTFRGDGVLYLHSQDDNGLYTLDPATGFATLVGHADVALHGGDLTFDADDRLTIWTNDSSIAVGLYELDPSTAEATLVDPEPGSNLVGLAALGHSDVLYGANIYTDRLYTINPRTGLTGISVPLTMTGVRFDHKRGDLDSPYCVDDAACEDADPCTTDRCTAGGCRHLLEDATCDGVDDDCDGLYDEDYAPVPSSCGVGACAAAGATACVSGAVEDSCVPGIPAASDTTCDSVDDDCDGSTDEDYVAVATGCGVGACAAAGVTACVSGTVEGSCVPGIPAASDATCDGVDDDCDGQTDEGYVAVATICGVGACEAAGATACVSGAVEDSCVPGIPSASDATCDGVDDDCDGQTDEGYVAVATTCGVGACAAAGATACVSGAVEDSCAPGIPAASDTTCDSVDDDCDGQTDEGYVAVATTCGVGACAAAGVTACVSGVVEDSCVPGTPASSDTTCDGIDDDCDGQADEDGDADGDAVPSCFDNCPRAANADQADIDADSAGDACDCAPSDPLNGPAVEVDNSLNTTKTGDVVTLAWTDGGVAGPFRVYRGFVRQGASWSYNHYCLGTSVQATVAQENLTPLPGTLFYYVVSREGCSESILGRDSGGDPIPNNDPCPSAGQDADGDGIEEALDNCPGLANADQLDADGDGIGDACE